MNRCPRCEYLVPPAWDACKKCGAPLLATVAAAPVGPNGSSHPAPTPTAAPGPVAAPRSAVAPGADTDLLPRPTAGRPSAGSTSPFRPAPKRLTAPGIGFGARTVAIVAVVVVLGALAFAFWPSGDDGSATNGALEILPPVGEGSIGVDTAFRVEAEAAARQVMVMVSQVYAETGALGTLTPELVASYDPATQFVAGGIASTSTAVASMQAGSDRVVIAIAGNADICAFGQVDAQMTVSFVTAKTPTCRAIDAPQTGWSGQTGGGGIGAADAAALLDT